ncbi:LCP family protein [uncultured Anaeromusa sp.]|uniref:LCP family protein n=1 Tax=uncultured Anaeromusa sp. TaxID=673273 RepID=UPI0029C69622|nr:LCP family protein [uncultured Anaeromusa sp.]
MRRPLSERQRLRRTKPRKLRWGRVVLLLLLLLLFLAGLVRGGIWLWSQAAPTSQAVVEPVQAAQPAPAPEPAVAAPAKPLYAKPQVATSRLNVLLLGVDDGEYGIADAPKRSDTMILANIDPATGIVTLVSLPRDTQVLLPGRKEAEKLGHAYAYGGPALTVKAVEDLLQIPVNYYVTLHWQGFIRCVDSLGGVDLYVEQDMNYEDPYAALAIHLNKGYQHLDGDKSGQYVRFRSDELGDIGRAQRQQRFLRALANQAFQWETLARLPELQTVVKESFLTDIQGSDWLRLAAALRHFDRAAGLKPVLLPGRFVTEKSVSYWKADENATKELVNTKLLEAAVTNEGGK